MDRIRVLLFAIAALMALAAPAGVLAGKFNRVLSAGDAAPDWSGLVGVDDQEHALADYAEAKVVVLVFISNHCPVATAYEDRLIALAEEYQDRGVALIAANCNTRPADRLSAMKKRAAAKGFNFPYLYDPSQATGRAYGAARTPEVFVLDGERKIAYLGAIDDSWRDADKVKRHYLRDALEALAAGGAPPVAESKPTGCEIEYLSGDEKRDGPSP